MWIYMIVMHGVHCGGIGLYSSAEEAQTAGETFIANFVQAEYSDPNGVVAGDVLDLLISELLSGRIDVYTVNVLDVR